MVRNGWAQQMQPIPAGLNNNVQMRKVSLRQIAAVLEDCAKNNKPIPDAAMFLAGLQRIHYVFVYPEQKDIVLVGPGEGWKVDGTGNVVGVTTGLPVMMLDNLLTALRSAKAAAQGGIDCSIDPTPEGMVRLKKVGRRGPTARKRPRRPARPTRRRWGCSRSASAACPIRAISPACWWPPTIA